MPKPIITASVVDTNWETTALTDDPNVLIKYFSDAKATMSAKPQGAQTIDEDMYIIRNGGKTAFGKEYTFENVESNEFTFSAADNSGLTNSVTLTPTMIDYIKVTCNIAHNRPDALGNMTVACSGDYFNDTFGDAAGAAENSLTVQYRYSTANGAFSDWTDMRVTLIGNSYYASASLEIPNFNQNSFYSFETRAWDMLTSADSSENGVKSLPVFHWGENDFTFEVPVNFKAGTNGATFEEVDGDLSVTGNLRLKGDGNYGNYLNFGDGNYCYIAELTDDEMTIRASKIHLSADGVYVDNYPIPILEKGVWTPRLNSSAISYYTTQYGWYSKMGQTVTVGFYIKATCNSGYSSTVISISGLPFVPMHSAAGGGLCSGAYMGSGVDFQCYVAETSGSITTRVQAYNTSATNLSTSASGCFYRSGGGEITLSGTITFMSTT